MKFAAVSDLHYPVFSKLFIKSLEKLSKDIEFFILAGDIASKGSFEFFAKVVELIKKYFPNIDIYACFGNEEYDEEHENLKKIKEVVFLEDELKIVNIKTTKIALIGTRGVIDKPTPWQRKNISNIINVYRQRIEKIKNLILEAKGKAETIILFSHYAPTYSTLKGERKEIYPFLGSIKMEKVIRETKPDIAVHGHAHNGTGFCVINTTRIYNVALPLNKKITTIDLYKGLERFW